MKNLLKIVIISVVILSTSCKQKTDATPNNKNAKTKSVEPTVIKSSESATGAYATLSSNFIINHSERWQLLASSQNYNSNYAVYAKFRTEKAEKSSDSLRITSADFILLNYKNLVYLGLEDIVIKSIDGNLFVRIYVKALGKYHGLATTEEEISNSHNSEIILKKKNLDLWVKNDHILKSQRVLLPLHLITKKAASKIDSNEVFKKHYEFSKDYSRYGEELTYAKSNDGKLFDNEFFYKDGIYITPRKDYDSGELNEESKFTDDMLAPDNRCRDAKFRLLISK